MKRPIPRSAVLAGLLIGLALGAEDCLAQRGPFGRSAAADAGEAAQPREFHDAKGLFATGLAPVFPQGIECPGISSPFGSATRHDGSPRVNDHGGIHNGMDITLATGTPLLAVSDGEVVHAGTGGLLVGNFVWLRFAPDATGLPGYVFARYQHLDQPTPLTVGERVAKGQPVGLSGNSGTAGRHYGAQGYPHLHLNTLIAPGAEFSRRGPMVVATGFAFLDPLGLYLGEPVTPLDNHALRALPAARKQVAVPVATVGGRIAPESARTIWPVACR